MKNNQKKLHLIKYGIKPSIVSNLTESQVNSLFSRLTESKKETKEQSQVITQVYDSKDKNQMSKLNQMLKDPAKLQGQNIQVKETEMSEDMDSQMDWLMRGKTQDVPQTGPTGDGDPDSIQEKEMMEEFKNLYEKFESKKQQRYFFAKCGDGKTKEQKKWCKMADEFAEKTNFNKIPEKKEETNEEGMSNYTKKVASAYAGGLKKQLNNTKINPTFGESEIEKRIMSLVEKHITPKMSKKDFLKLVREASPATAPTKPGVKPDVDTPTKPTTPSTPYKPKPGVKPNPKAKKDLPTWLKFSSIGIQLKK